jgi:hypothetical protein
VTPLVSVIVNNFNYERYLPVAIESALAQDHPEVEVIVVDDGSTDGSHAVIGAYEDRLAAAVMKENGGQASAMNAGFDAAGGELVLFLDADDYLEPTAASAVVAAWVPGCSKVQFRLSIVDSTGARAGCQPAAEVAMPSGDLLPMLARTGAYPSPVTSGNAYGRGLLERIMPIPEREFRISADGYLNALAPVYGPVVSIDRELGAYRRHEANRWAISHDPQAAELRVRVEHDLVRERLLREAARQQGRPLPADVALRDWNHVVQRLGHLRLDPAAHPVASDTRLQLGRAAIRAARVSPEFSGAERLGYACLAIVLACAPRPLARRAVSWALASKPRPEWLRRGRQALRAINVRRHGGAA